MSAVQTGEQKEWLAKIEQIAEDVCQREGCVLYDIEYSGSPQGRILRVFVDKNVEGGSSIDDCTNVSRGLNEVLDTNEDAVPGGEYTLEVSTPGVDRVLTKPWHFEKAVGKKIRVKTREALEKSGVTAERWKAAKNVEEKLASADGEGITFDVKDGPVKIPFAAIEKAKIVFEMPAKGQKKK